MCLYVRAVQVELTPFSDIQEMHTLTF